MIGKKEKKNVVIERIVWNIRFYSMSMSWSMLDFIYPFVPLRLAINLLIHKQENMRESRES